MLQRTKSLNPLSRVNSILIEKMKKLIEIQIMSQSPKSGQFNSDNYHLLDDLVIVFQVSIP